MLRHMPPLPSPARDTHTGYGYTMLGREDTHTPMGYSRTSPRSEHRVIARTITIAYLYVNVRVPVGLGRSVQGGSRGPSVILV